MNLLSSLSIHYNYPFIKREAFRCSVDRNLKKILLQGYFTLLKSSVLSFLLCLISAIASGCSWINDDLLPCAPKPNTFVNVNFVYDYNMQYVNLFNNEVGAVYLYVFDQDSIMLLRREKTRSKMNRDIDFSMCFDTTEIHPGNVYHFVAMAQGNHTGYEVSSDSYGFTLLNEMTQGKSKISDYIIKLDRDDNGEFDFGVVDFIDSYGNNVEKIETVWSTKPGEVQTIFIPEPAYKPSVNKYPPNNVNVFIPMMRITNSITINLISETFNEDTDAEDYRLLIYFPKGNGTLDFTGNTHPAQPLYYRSLRKKCIPYTPPSSGSSYKISEFPKEETSYAIQADFGVSRLQVSDNSSFQIRNAENNEIITEITDFSDFLANYFEHGEDNQEFLDREYDFTVNIGLIDNKISWIQAGVSILGWGKRLQYVDL